MPDCILADLLFHVMSASIIEINQTDELTLRAVIQVKLHSHTMHFMAIVLNQTQRLKLEKRPDVQKTHLMLILFVESVKKG
jgi:hypothetical protein